MPCKNSHNGKLARARVTSIRVRDPTLLFGFCAPTEQPPHSWKRKELAKKLSMLQYTAILDQSEKDRLLDILKTKSFLNIDGEKLTLNLES